MNGEISVNKDTLNSIKNYDYNQEGNIKFTSIILLTYNKLEYTKLCINSIRKFTPKGQYEIIVVDNNSSDGTQEYLKKQDDLKVIFNDYNAGFPKGCNQGIEISKGESILLLNNDTIVTPNWLNNLDRALYSDELIGGVGSITNNCSNGQAIKVHYKNIDEMFEFSDIINDINQENYELRQSLIGYCYLIKKCILDKVGLLDERFTPGNYEDNDISFRIISNGYKLLLCKDSFIHHFGNTSFGNDVQKFVDLLYTNQDKFNQKWGFNIDKCTKIRTDLINLMSHQKESNINVLDIGCGSGATLLHIKNVYKNANLYGVEINESVSNIAKTFANIINEDIEKIVLPYEKEYFDYIVLGNILEYLNEPWEVISNLKAYLKEDGYILASIPNIMNIHVVKKILNGRFTSTNSKLFTASEIQSMFSNNNLKIDNFYCIEEQINTEDEKLIDTLCAITNVDNKVQYISQQYLVKAYRND